MGPSCQKNFFLFFFLVTSAVRVRSASATHVAALGSRGPALRCYSERHGKTPRHQRTRSDKVYSPARKFFWCGTDTARTRHQPPRSSPWPKTRHRRDNPSRQHGVRFGAIFLRQASRKARHACVCACVPLSLPHPERQKFLGSVTNSDEFTCRGFANVRGLIAQHTVVGAPPISTVATMRGSRESKGKENEKRRTKPAQASCSRQDLRGDSCAAS